MGTFSTKKILQGSPALIPTIADELAAKFQSDGFEVAMDALSSGGYDISITKGGVFKAVLGMKTALKVTLLPQGSNIHFEAGVGIWGQQAIPTVISMLLFWPVLITQIWGMVEQAKLDDKLAKVMANTGSNPAEMKTLLDAKKNLSATISQLAEQSCLSLKHNKNASKGENTWTGKIKKLKDMDLILDEMGNKWETLARDE